MSDTGPAVRPPQQRRSRESYERVLESARSLLAENGFDGFTIQDVAARSGVSVGAIYERFGNKEMLLRSVHAALMDAMAQQGANVWTKVSGEGDGAEAAIASAVALVARTFRENRELLRAFMHLGAVDEVIAARGSRSSTELGARFKQALLAHRTEFGHADPEVAVDVAFRMVYSTCARQVMYGPVFESERRLSWKRMVSELSIACTAYLLAPAAST